MVARDKPSSISVVGKKRQYRAPEVKVFGRVRELTTGGSNGSVEHTSMSMIPMIFKMA